MGGNTHNTDVDPEDLEKATALWNAFTKYSTYAVIAIIVVLVLMALTLL